MGGWGLRQGRGEDVPRVWAPQGCWVGCRVVAPPLLMTPLTGVEEAMSEKKNCLMQSRG